MNPQQLAAVYQQATTLAEAGQYEPSLAHLSEVLRHRPQDGQALNDAATILFCTGRGREAIELYEKAMAFCTGDQLTQIQWNLCEACLQEGQIGRAIGLFDAIESAGLLNADMLNRAADGLLQKNLLGPAVELLLRSLELNPDQEILKPMLDVIRSHRARVAIVNARRHTLSRSLAEGLAQRLAVTLLDEPSDRAAEVPVETQIAVFVGCGPTLVNASMQPNAMRIAAILDTADVLAPQIQMVNWRAVQTVILCGGSEAVDLFSDQLGRLPEGLTVMTAEPVPNPERISFAERKKGKRIAALGPWDARHNPMFALMCFQKLHYLDSDTRLYLGGAFTDAAVERYTQSLIERLGLDNVVFLDGPVKEMKKWLRDKHYILSTAIDGAGMENVWAAMAAGLRPVVHAYPAVGQRMDEGWVFTLPEEFCRQVLNGSYDSSSSRAAAVDAYLRNGLEPVVMDQIFRFEQELSPANQAATIATSPVASSLQDPLPLQANPAFVKPTVSHAASEALAASKQMNYPPFDYSPQPPAVSLMQAFAAPVDAQRDCFNGDNEDALSVEAMAQLRRDNVQRRRKTMPLN